jgi:protein-disulfide isomerase
MNGEIKQQDAKIEAMSKWCEEAEITHTPTIFVNGHRLPENYNVGELKNIL